MTRRKLPKYVSEFSDRHGKMRVRFRRKGHSDHYFKARPWTDEFMREYQACLDGVAAPRIVNGKSREKPGTLSALIALYYTTPEFAGLRPSTKATYRGIIERFRERHGDKRVATIERKHVKAILGAMSDRPSAANNLLDRLKALMALAVDIGWRKDDPTLRMRGYRTSSDGFHTWTEEEIAAFEAVHPIGSKPRLALALMLYTGQRRSDAVTMGWQHVTGNRIKVSQQKTNARLEIPMHPTLRKVMEMTPRENMTFLMTSFGKPFTPAGLGNWFREQCDNAGLPHCTAHGLRKAAARRLAEAGCSYSQIKAITGHKTDKEVARYTSDANQSLLAEQAMAAVYGAEGEQKTSNSSGELDKTPTKPMKSKEI
tara:strand:- start:1952 stop:3061 length:1110 start_codon:yes stop_codon:yes gene_type:complete